MHNVLHDPQGGEYLALASSASDPQSNNLQQVSTAPCMLSHWVNTQMLRLYVFVLAVVIFLWALPFPNHTGIPAAQNPGVTCTSLLVRVCVGAWVQPWQLPVVCCVAACLASWAAVYLRHLQALEIAHIGCDIKATGGALFDHFSVHSMPVEHGSTFKQRVH